ncbi:hypothetical protein EV356DRAFT_578671 [Viridothelium virens]|uniref:Lysine decarboxylase-like protein-like protein n=1 Tax=Viridothelium virens TaxID=1048519 RepID=A0A6A6H2M8_VIRVR|nr:hypothetical protein EV356DRAFT_578671 [Viridothelium virens]
MAASSGSHNDVPAPNATTKKGPVVCVFCGASPGTSPAHMEAARALAHAFHANNISLVYGGGTVGLMGEVARTLVSLSGAKAVHGIIPAALVKYEQGYDPHAPSAEHEARRLLDEKVFGRTTVVADMHTRKQMMAKEVIEGGDGSGFVALSGGYGTLEELMEVVTWNQLGIHGMGIVAYNVEGYWDGLMKWVRTAVTHGFVAPPNAHILVEALTAEEVVRSLKEYKKSEGRFDLEWNEK